MEAHMVGNGYIDRSVQKGFLSGVPGCVDHSFTLWEALKRAKTSRTQIVTTWIDLANAYGSVRHNLIQYALEWYHVPEFIQKLIFNYYEKLCAQVVTKEWSTGFFLFDIGLFQGCVLSTILFDAVFNLLLDFLKPLDHLAFKNKGIKTKRLVKAYADDLTLTTSLPEHNQLALDRMCTWLDWTVTMKAKPKKCYHLAMRIFDKRWPHKKFTQYHDELTYSPYDAHLTIKGQRVHFIANPQTEDPFKAKHFKFLGRNMHVDLSEQDVVEKVGRDLRQRLALVDKDPVFGLAKLWIYQFYILSFLAWPFLIHDFAISHVKALQPPTNKLLRRWAGLYKSADESILYRSREQFGLQLTSLTTHFKRMQVIKSHTLKHSNDPDVVDHYEQRALREKDISVWKGSQLLEVCEAMANHDFKFKGQNDRRGLGNGVYDPEPSGADHRKACGQAILKLESERYRGKVGCFERQGVWLQWSALAQPFDLSWKNLLWGRHDTPLFKFVLNATLNTVVTPTLRKLWNYVRRADCALCGHRKCTLHHIICNCKVALKQKRYTWRHDSVLNTLQPFLQELVEAANARPASKPEESKIPPHSDSFRPKGAAGGVKTVSKPHPKTKDGILYGARDWKLRIDLHKDKKNFPADICQLVLDQTL